MSDAAPAQPERPTAPTAADERPRPTGAAEPAAPRPAPDSKAPDSKAPEAEPTESRNGDRAASDGGADSRADGDGGPDSAARKRRRGSRGGRNRTRSGAGSRPGEAGGTDEARPAAARRNGKPGSDPAATPVVDRWDAPAEPVDAPSSAAPVRKPRIGDSRPAPTGPAPGAAASAPEPQRPKRSRSSNRRGGGGKRGARSGAPRPVEATLVDEPAEVDEETLARRRGRERKGRPVGRYLMVVHKDAAATQIAVLEGRNLLEHYVSRPSDDATQIDGNIYVGRVKNVLPGMEAAFVDIGTPKNAVLYRGDLRNDGDDLDSDDDGDGKPKGKGGRGGRGRGGRGANTVARSVRIEEILKPGQTVVCQVTKNPIAHKGARLTQEVSLPGRFVVLVPNSDTYGISKRLADDERKRLRRILDEIRPPGHGLIVRTAAEGATADELTRDVARLLDQWTKIEALAAAARGAGLVYREPDRAVRVIREEFNRNYRGVVIDDAKLYEEVRGYVASISPELADRVELVLPEDDPLPVFERHHVHEQLHKALDRKVWLPSGGSLIIERTEALTVIDVNTGKNVGSSNLEETVFRNNLEAAEEIAHQLRLRDIGGIIVIDYIDMEIAANRAEVMKTFKAALARDKTRTQVFDISELGLVEMTRKRVSEGLVESLSHPCPLCGGRGLELDESLL